MKILKNIKEHQKTKISHTRAYSITVLNLIIAMIYIKLLINKTTIFDKYISQNN